MNIIWTRFAELRVFPSVIIPDRRSQIPRRIKSTDNVRMDILANSGEDFIASGLVTADRYARAESSLLSFR